MGNCVPKGQYDYKSRKLSKEQYKELRKGFSQVADGKKTLSRVKWIEIAKQTGVSDEQVAAVTFDAFDIDQNGSLDEQEFLDMSSLMLAGTPEEQLRASFHYFDKDRNGKLCKDELRLKLRAVVCNKFSERSQPLSGDLQTEVYDTIDNVLETVFKKLDHDLSGDIDIEEYTKGFSNDTEVLDFLKML